MLLNHQAEGSTTEVKRDHTTAMGSWPLLGVLFLLPSCCNCRASDCSQSLVATLTLQLSLFLFAQFHHCPTAPEQIELALPSFDRPLPGKSLVTGAQLNIFNKEFFFDVSIYKAFIEFVIIAFRFYGCFIQSIADLNSPTRD